MEISGNGPPPSFPRVLEISGIHPEPEQDPPMEKLKKVQNFHELLQSDLLIWRLGRRASLNWGRAYHGNATKHCEEADVEGTHVPAKPWYPTVRRNTYEMRGGHTRAKNC